MENTRFENIDNKDGFVITVNLEDTKPQTSSNYGMFFTAHIPCEVLTTVEKHGTAGTDASAVTLQIERLTGTTAKGSGDSILKTAFNLKNTAYTHTKYSGSDLQNRQLKVGESLSLKSSGTLTALKDLQVTVYLKPLTKGDYR